MKTTREQLQKAAQDFLNIADELNEKVSRYFDGSDDKEDVAAYDKVRAAEMVFTKHYNAYYEENIKCALNYELAESVL